MSALPHNQVGAKLEWRAKRNYTIVEFPTHVKICLLMGELWHNVVGTQQVLLYSSPHDDSAHTAVQLQHNDRFSNCVLFYWLYKLYCSDGWKKCTGVMAVATEMVLQWHCLLNNVVCSTALSSEQCGVQYSGRLLFYLSAYTAWHRALCDFRYFHDGWANSHPQFMSLCTEPCHNFYIKNRINIGYQPNIVSSEIWRCKFSTFRSPGRLHSTVFDA